MEVDVLSKYYSGPKFDLRASLWDLRDSFTDVTLVCGRGKESCIAIRAHKIILAASSTYFHRILALRGRDEIVLSKTRVTALQDLLIFIYTGRAPNAAGNFSDFVKLGQKFSVKGLPTWTDRQLTTDPEDTIQRQGSDFNRPRKRKRLNSSISKYHGLSAITGIEPVSKLVCRRPRLKLTCLPDEILLKILSYVPTYDLVQNVARVSKHFHHLTRDPDAHVSITFTNHVNTDKVVAFLKNKRKIEELHLMRVCNSMVKSYGIHDLWYHIIVQLKKIRVIEVNRPWHLSSKMIDILGQDPLKAKYLTKLIANASMYRGDDEVNWTHPTSLKHLELNGYPTTGYILEIGQTTNQLEHLRSTSTLAHSEGMKYLFQVNKASLVDVQLPGYQCSDNDITSLSHCRKMECLCLDCSMVSPQALGLISNLVHLSTLKLELSRHTVTPKDIVAFLSLQQQLKELSLTYDGTFDDLIMTSVSALSDLSNLTLTSKGDNSEVTDQGFYEVFSHCVQLNSLILKMPINFVDLEEQQEQQSFGDWAGLHQPNLKYLLPGIGCLLSRKTIKTMLRRSSALRACLQSDTLFVKADTTCGEIFDGFDISDLSNIKLSRVVMF